MRDIKFMEDLPIPVDVQRAVVHWFDTVILPGSHADGTFEKLAEEFDELREAHKHFWQASTYLSDGPEDDATIREAFEKMKYEAADVFITLIAWCYAAEVPLGKATYVKHRVNEQRDWGEADERGVRRHI